MRVSVVRCVRKGLFSSLMGKTASAKSAEAVDFEPSALSKEQQVKLKSKLSMLRKKEEKPSTEVKLRDVHEDDDFGGNFMDSIRARGLLKYRYNYSPPTDVDVMVKAIAKNYDSAGNDLAKKSDILRKLGAEFNHYVPNSALHKMKTVNDLLEFYRQEVKNITRYQEMARDQSLPSNLNIREQPSRFHPNDVHSSHKGVTAFPGVGGEVLGLRNKRIYRQFNPKKEWFDYEDMSFDYTKVDADMPWDPEVAKRMDSFVDKKYSARTRSFQKTSK
ncbi:hypothetical protein L596_001838 [Steinernema carpocapsae]|uniref:Large ribosomal subunit protein mL50 n=1 Tax=Steinernema carpocapsae TaxID=34508 RepID=A0A4U8UMX6_STECR|nr:hypothetical protein L596_001838 [Steinernema carpocapsae]